MKSKKENTFKDVGEFVPDARVLGNFQGQNFEAAIELELTQKEKIRIVQKVKHYLESKYYNHAFYFFPKSSLLENYREAQRKSGVPYTGTHILRHGMAKLARQVGGGLDAVLAMTGHKDLKLADHYSKSNEDDQKHFSEMVMDHIRKALQKDKSDVSQACLENVISLKNFKKANNS